LVCYEAGKKRRKKKNTRRTIFNLFNLLFSERMRNIKGKVEEREIYPSNEPRSPVEWAKRNAYVRFSAIDGKKSASFFHRHYVKIEKGGIKPITTKI
jgi:hypothetical protein